MSVFLGYFETKNIDSKNYDDFANVGIFQFPQIFLINNTNIFFNKKIYKAFIFGDDSKMCANNFFTKKNSKEIRKILSDFIKERVKNECVIANIFLFINDGKNYIELSNICFRVKFEEFDLNFNLNSLENGRVLQVSK